MEHDDGYSFGIGVFETMLVKGGRCIMMERHMDRLLHGLDVLGLRIDFDPSVVHRAVSDGSLDGRVLKVEVSERNTILTDRRNPYDPSDYEKGFSLRTSPVRRNETSPLTFIKSLCCADSIMERRKAVADGFDEVLFLNLHGEVCECASSNIFFAEGNRVSTPCISSGMLPGTLRSFVIDEFDVEERTILPEEIPSFTGCFITNSVMGVMPVSSIDGHGFDDRTVAGGVDRAYRRAVEDGLRRNPVVRTMYLSAEQPKSLYSTRISLASTHWWPSLDMAAAS